MDALSRVVSVIGGLPVLILAPVLILPTGGEETLSLTNTSGVVFERVEIKEVRPTGLYVFHSGGITLIPFRELPKDVQQKYDYDPSREREYLKNTAEAQKQAQRQRLINDGLSAIARAGLKATIRVIQVADGGVLATGTYVTQEKYKETETVTHTVPGLDHWSHRTWTSQRTETKVQAVEHGLPDRIFIVGSFSNAVDDDRYSFMIYPCGRYQYTTVMRAGATIPRFATSPQKALELLLADQ